MSEIIWENDIPESSAEQEVTENVENNVENTETVENTIDNTNEINQAIEEELNKANALNDITDNVYNTGLVSKETLYQVHELVPSISVESMSANLTTTPSPINADEVLVFLETVKNDTFIKVNDLIKESTEEFNKLINRLKEEFNEDIETDAFNYSSLDTIFNELYSNFNVLNRLRKTDTRILNNFNKEQYVLYSNVINTLLPLNKTNTEIKFYDNEGQVEVIDRVKLLLGELGNIDDCTYAFNNELIPINDLNRLIQADLIATKTHKEIVSNNQLLANDKTLYALNNLIKKSVLLNHSFLQYFNNLSIVLNDFICNCNDKLKGNSSINTNEQVRILNDKKLHDEYSSLIVKVVEYLNKYKEAIQCKAYAFNRLMKLLNETFNIVSYKLNEDVRNIDTDYNTPDNIKEVYKGYISKILENGTAYLSIINNIKM